MRATSILLVLLILATGSSAMDYFPFHHDAQYTYVLPSGVQGYAGFEGMSRHFGYNDMGFYGESNTYSIWNGHLMLEYWERGHSLRGAMSGFTRSWELSRPVSGNWKASSRRCAARRIPGRTYGRCSVDTSPCGSVDDQLGGFDRGTVVINTVPSSGAAAAVPT